jgi:predicted ATPase
MQRTITGAVPPTDDQLDALAARAKETVEDPDRAERKPVVIEFAGSPKSGKSTTIDVISHFFKRMGFKVRAPTEGASKRTPYNLRRDLVAFNSYTLNYAISELLDAYHNVEQPDLVLLDRGPFDSIAWLKYLQDQGALAEKEFETLRNFALSPLWTKLISKIYVFRCDSDVSMRREHSAKLTRLSGTAMNPKTLEALRIQYEELGELLTNYPLAIVDTSHDTSPIATSFEIAEEVLGLLEEA